MSGDVDPKIVEGAATGVWHIDAASTVEEFVGLQLNELFTCGLLCSFRPGLVAKTYSPPECIDIKQQSSTHRFLIRYPDCIVQMDTDVNVSIIPRHVTREQLHEIALLICRECEPLCPDPAEEGTPEFLTFVAGSNVTWSESTVRLGRLWSLTRTTKTTKTTKTTRTTGTTRTTRTTETMRTTRTTRNRRVPMLVLNV